MAKGDLKSSRRSYGGSGYSYSYNDEGRGYSKTLWEEFEIHFRQSGYDAAWLLNDNEQRMLKVSLYDTRLYKYIHDMTWRFNIHDWAHKRFEDSEQNDGRVRRLVVQKCGVEIWQQLQVRAAQVWEKIREEEKRVQHERSQEWAQESAAFEAQRIQRETEEKQTILKDVSLVAGMLQSDFHVAFDSQDVYAQDEGDWIDDPVDTYRTGRGWAYENKKATGIKLQFTVCLDRSNSVYYNRIDKVMAETFRDMYLALEQLRQEHPDDITVAAFEFCIDGDEASERGRNAECLNTTSSWWRKDIGDLRTDWGAESLGAVEKYRDPRSASFSGEDTWFYPLFEKVEQWENKFGNPGAIKIDLVLTDAVIEHPSDIKRSDEIQERRDGILHTVLLNFLPEHEWVNSDLPLRCVQYPVTADNVAGMLRNIVSEYVRIYA